MADGIAHSSPETPAACRWGGEVLAVAALLSPGLAVFAPLGLAPLLGIAALAILALDGRRAIAAARRWGTLALLLAALSLWAFLSVAWSILPQHSFIEACRLLAISAGGVVVCSLAMALAPQEREKLGRALVVGVVVAVVFLVVERISGAALTRWALHVPAAVPLPLTRFDRGATVLALALWPALLALGARRKGVQLFLLAVAATATVFAMESTTAKLAVLLGFVVFALACAVPRLVAAALAAGILLAAIGLPLATPQFTTVVTISQRAPWLKVSAVHRLMIWRFVADRIAERPLLGWGLDASRELPGGHANLHELYPQALLPSDAVALPLHPHDALLQWEVELGVPGAVLGLGILGWGLWQVGYAAALTRSRRAGALAWAAAAVLIACLSFGIWQEWWLSCLWLTAAFHGGGGLPSRPS